MAKALIGHLNSDLRGAGRLSIENARLRSRVVELEELVRRLAEENDALAAHVASLVTPELHEQLDEALQPV